MDIDSHQGIGSAIANDGVGSDIRNRSVVLKSTLVKEGLSMLRSGKHPQSGSEHRSSILGQHHSRTLSER